MKSNVEVAHEVIQGAWGNGNERKERLEKAGYDYATIQAIVGKLLNGEAVEEVTPLEVTVDLKKHDKLILNLVM